MWYCKKRPRKCKTCRTYHYKFKDQECLRCYHIKILEKHESKTDLLINNKEYIYNGPQGIKRPT